MGGSGMRLLTGQVAGRLRRLNGGHLPCCHKCRRPITKNKEYYSRQSRKRVYYHLSCWERAALAEKD